MWRYRRLLRRPRTACFVQKVKIATAPKAAAQAVHKVSPKSSKSSIKRLVSGAVVGGDGVAVVVVAVAVVVVVVVVGGDGGGGGGGGGWDG